MAKFARYRGDRERSPDDSSDPNGNGRSSSGDDPYHDEPLSLAEEIAAMADRGQALVSEFDEKARQGDTHIAELQKMSMPQLIEEARKENLQDVAGLKRQDLIFRLLKERVKMSGLM